MTLAAGSPYQQTSYNPTRILEEKEKSQKASLSQGTTIYPLELGLPSLPSMWAYKPVSDVERRWASGFDLLRREGKETKPVVVTEAVLDSKDTYGKCKELS